MNHLDAEHQGGSLEFKKISIYNKALSEKGALVEQYKKIQNLLSTKIKKITLLQRQ